ncbi:MAG: hypothetical protein K1Y36_29675 [Blastocatellia bacterium]|nr:hypothetical protein [Blastocatellia bacterium]
MADYPDPFMSRAELKEIVVHFLIFSLMFFLGLWLVIPPLIDVANSWLVPPTREEALKMYDLMVSLPKTMSWALCIGWAVHSLAAYNHRRDRFRLWRAFVQLEEIERRKALRVAREAADLVADNDHPERVPEREKRPQLRINSRKP